MWTGSSRQGAIVAGRAVQSVFYGQLSLLEASGGGGGGGGALGAAPPDFAEQQKSLLAKQPVWLLHGCWIGENGLTGAPPWPHPPPPVAQPCMVARMHSQRAPSLGTPLARCTPISHALSDRMTRAPHARAPLTTRARPSHCAPRPAGSLLSFTDATLTPKLAAPRRLAWREMGDSVTTAKRALKQGRFQLQRLHLYDMPTSDELSSTASRLDSTQQSAYMAQVRFPFLKQAQAHRFHEVTFLPGFCTAQARFSFLPTTRACTTHTG